MQTAENVADGVLKLIPGGDHCLAHLSDDEVLRQTRHLAGRSNQLFAALLLHLAEVETRGIHRQCACSSLYLYCVYELRLSEDAAARRSSAARLVKKFPALFDAVARGELHLTGLLLLGPHLSEENCADVLSRAKFRTKKEIAKLMRELHPLPAVPDLLEPLGPLLPNRLCQPTWQQHTAALAGPVRSLPPGQRPLDWVNDNQAAAEIQAADAADCATYADSGLDVTAVGHFDLDPLPAGPPRGQLPPITRPQQYQMRFCTTEEHADLVERAKALLAKSSPGLSLGELHLQAMKLLVEKLEKAKFALTGDRAPHGHGITVVDSTIVAHASDRHGPNDDRIIDVHDTAAHHDTAARHGAIDGDSAGASTDAALTPRRRGRKVPAAVKREVHRRDGGRCAYVNGRGGRCGETRFLELHHLTPFARDGHHTVANISLRCAAHNALAAEQDFGRIATERKRDAARHQSWSKARSPDG